MNVSAPEAPLTRFVLRHAAAIDHDMAVRSILSTFCSFCGGPHAPCARNLSMARLTDPRLAPERVRLGLMRDRDLMQLEWRGGSARYYVRDLQKAPSPPSALVAEQERRVSEGEAADAELTRRGVHERFC